MQLIHKTFALWVAVGIALPAALGLAHHRHLARRVRGGAVGRRRCGSSSSTT